MESHGFSRVGGCESSADFTPDTADGETTVDFHFNTNGLDDTTVVVFEKMFYGKAEIAAHEDINDKGQTIYIPSVKTTAIDDKNSNKAHTCREGHTHH